jgi:hypothetical protein
MRIVLSHSATHPVAQSCEQQLARHLALQFLTFYGPFACALKNNEHTKMEVERLIELFILLLLLLERYNINRVE